MATNITTTSYVIEKNKAIQALQGVEPLFNLLTGIIANADDTFTFVSAKVKQGNLIKTPMVQATKTDISNFLQTYSGLSVSSSLIKTVTIADDISFILVTV